MKKCFGGILSRFGGTRVFARLASLCVILAAAQVSADNVLNFTRSPDTYVTTTGRITSAAFTVEVWIRQSQFDAENQILNQDIGGDAGRLFLATINGTNRFQVGSTQLHGTSRLTANVWNHLAFVRTSGGAATIYVNGTVDRSGTLPTATPAITNIVIGRLPRIANLGFRGQIADVRVWNVARSQSDIQNNKNIRLTGTEPNLIHYWPLDEGAGATITYDRAANAHGTITGATWADFPDLPLSYGNPEGTWVSTQGGNWSDPALWLNQIPAQGISADAFFTNQPPAALAVTNDLADLKIGRLTVSGDAPHTFSGNTLTLTNQFGAARLVSTNGAHTFNLPLATSANGLSIEAAAPAELAITQPISGPAAIAVNPWASGGGTVTFSAANTFSGPLTIGCGTLSVSSLADGGQPCALGNASADPANLVLGAGTLRYTGPSTTMDRGITINAGARKASLLSLDNDLTITGPITNVAGAFIKTGPGTLTYAAPVASLIGRQQSSSIITPVPYPTNGDAPTNGFGCFTVAGGKVILGANPAQTNLFNEEVTVGAYTTDQAGQEVTAELEFVGGYHRFNSLLDIGYYNGTTVTAPTPLQPTITVSGGTISAAGMIIAFGYNTNQNTHAVLNITGGTLAVDGSFRFGDQRGDPASPMHATINVTSGAFIHTSPSENMRMGWRSGGAADATLNIFGGLFDEYGIIVMSQYGSTSRVNLHGGILRAIDFQGYTSGTEILFLNGGTFQPRPHPDGISICQLDTLDQVLVSTNGACIDTSLASYIIAQDLLHDPELGDTPDGGLVKTGTNTLTIAFTNATYTGVTAANEGELRIGGNATQTVSLAALTVASGAAVGFTFKADGSSNDRLTLAQPPDFASGARVALTVTGTELPFTKNGTYTLLTYAGAAPSVSGLACANPVYGKRYTFAASDGSLTVTISTETATDSVWNVDADGDWSNAGNWSVAHTPGTAARFDDAITAPRTVATAGQNAGDLFFNSAHTYTLGGSGLTLTDGAGVFVESGAHVIGAPLALAGDTAVSLAPATQLTLGPASGSAALTAQGNGTLALTAAPEVSNLVLDVPETVFSNSMSIAAPVTLQRNVTLRNATDTAVTVQDVVSGNVNLTKTGAGTLTLSAANTYSGVTRIDNGTLSVPALADGGQPSPIGSSAFNAANLLIGPATFRYTGASNIISRGITLQAGSGRAAVIRVEEGGDIAFGVWINATSGGFVKTGPGTLRYTGNANNLLHKDNVGSDARLNIGANGEGPTQGFFGCSIANGRLVLGAPFQTNTVASRLVVGINTTTEAAAETAGELVVTDGVLNMNNQVLAVSRNNGTTVTAPGGLSSRLTVTGGIITNANYISLGYQNMSLSGYNARPVMEMSGGYVHVNNFYIAESSGASATVILRGGILRPYGTARFAMAANTEALFVLDGDALFETVGAFDTQLGYNNASTAIATLRLNGGTLSTRNVVKAANAQGTLLFNGGTLKPHTAGYTLQNLTAAYVSTNGAVIDTSLAAYTVAQNLLRDPALADDPDGGLVKLGTNTLSLTGTGNTFNGPARVQSGLLRARFGGTNSLSVAAGAAFDALGVRCEVGDLTGYGPCTNGTLAAHRRLDAGTNGAPAGATMTVQHLTLTAGSTFACDWKTNTLGEVTTDFIAVSGTLAAESHGFVDFGRDTSAPVPIPFTAPVMSYGSFSGGFNGWKPLNTGLPAGANVALSLTAENGTVVLRLRYGGTLIRLR